MNAHTTFSQAKADAETTMQEWLVEAHKAAAEAQFSISIGDLVMAEKHDKWLDHCIEQAEKASSRARWYEGHASMYARETVQ